jgi:hypothetical protein
LVSSTYALSALASAALSGLPANPADVKTLRSTTI